MNFDSFLADVLATVAGGILLAAIFFFIKEKLSPITDVTGRWYVETKTERTAYNPYQGMVLRYVVMVWRDGHQLYGSSEKIYEASTTGTRNFIGKNRTRGEISGSIERNYLGADRIFVHIVEDGHGRVSTYFHQLEPFGHELCGSFATMVADQKGATTWKRTAF